MAILNFIYANAAMLDDPTLAYANIPAQLTPTSGAVDSTTADSFYYRKATSGQEVYQASSPQLGKRNFI